MKRSWEDLHTGFVCTGIGLQSVGVAQAAPYAEQTPQGIINQLLSQSQRFAEKHNHDYFSKFQGEQHPGITLLGCSDSRALCSGL